LELIANLFRKSYGFEIKREYVEGFKKEIAGNIQETIFQQIRPVKHGKQKNIFNMGVSE